MGGDYSPLLAEIGVSFGNLGLWLLAFWVESQ